MAAEKKLEQAQRTEASLRQALAKAPDGQKASIQAQLKTVSTQVETARASVAKLMKSHRPAIADSEKKTTEAIMAEVRKLLSEKPLDDEIARAKRKTISASVFDAQTAHSTAQRLASDFISTGEITKNVQATDFSMRFV